MYDGDIKMRVLLGVSALTFLASFAQAEPIRSHQEVTAYWGFGKDRRLADYCAPGQGIDNFILGSTTPLSSGGWAGAFGSSCYINTDGSFPSSCSTVAQDIRVCQAAGKKIFIGFSSGRGDTWAIKGKSGAADIASYLWTAYGGDLSHPSARPFGSVKVDGFDFDVENNPHNQSRAYLGTLVNDMRNHFGSDASKTYYISGAPECAIPDGHMGLAMMEAKFDYVWIQFYNGGCAAADVVKNPKSNPTDIGAYNFDKWSKYLAGGKSHSASLYIGLPASKSGAAPWDWIRTTDLHKVIEASAGAKGIMLWNTAHSDATVHNRCTYAQNIARLLRTGSTC